MAFDPIIEYQKIGISLSRFGSLFSGMCPFHAETVGSFVVYADLSYFCYGCKKGGPFKKLLKELEVSGLPDLNFESISLPELFSADHVIDLYFNRFMKSLEEVNIEDKKRLILGYEKLRIETDYLIFSKEAEADIIRYFFDTYSKLKQEAEKCQKIKNCNV